MTQRNFFRAALLLFGTALGLVAALYTVGEGLEAWEAGEPLAFDISILRTLRNWGDKHWDFAMLQFTALGSKPVLTLGAIGVFIAAWLAKERLIALKVAIAA